jgi:hypothetical protein
MTGWVRRASTTRLVVVAAVLVVVALGVAAAAFAMGGGASAPPATDLRSLVATQLAGQPPAGVTAHVTFRNDLVSSSTAEGQLWWTGMDLRLDLTSAHGAVELAVKDGVATVYKPGEKVAYRLEPGQGSSPATGGSPPKLFEGDVMGQLSKYVAFGDPQPTVAGGRPAYSIRVSPRDRSSLLDAVLLTVDAQKPVPLGIDVLASGTANPVLSLQLSDVQYGAVDASVFDLKLPDGVKVEQVTPPSADSLGSKLDGAAAGVSFPPTLGGLALAKRDHGFAVYGRGLGSIVVAAHTADANAASHVVETPLGTVVTVRRGDVLYIVAASLPRATVEAAAADL